LDHSGYGFFKSLDHLQFHWKSMETAPAQHLCKIRPSRILNSNSNYATKGKITRTINSLASRLFSEKWFSKNGVLGFSISVQLSDFVTHLFHFKRRMCWFYTRDVKDNPLISFSFIFYLFIYLFFSQAPSIKVLGSQILSLSCTSYHCRVMREKKQGCS